MVGLNQHIIATSHVKPRILTLAMGNENIQHVPCCSKDSFGSNRTIIYQKIYTVFQDPLHGSITLGRPCTITLMTLSSQGDERPRTVFIAMVQVTRHGGGRECPEL